MTTTGRNDPCPCGSGRKFKHCCLSRPQAATGITPRDRTEAFEALLKFSRRDQFDALVGDAAREWADLPDASTRDALETILQFQISAEAFFDWLFFDVSGDGGRTIADTFLQTREWTISSKAAGYLRVMRSTSLRLYQIRSLMPGSGFSVRDLWTKEDLAIAERRGSMQLAKWDVLAARIHPHADGTLQIEGSVMALPPGTARPLLKELKAEYKAFTHAQSDAPLLDFFKQSAPLIHDRWLADVALREPPTLVTNEGDPLTTSIVVFDVATAGEALVQLLLQPDFEPGSFGRAVWLEGTGDHRRILGEIGCDKGMLTLTTSSRARAARARSRLEEILGPLAIRHERHDEFDPHAAAMSSGPDEDGFIDPSQIPELQTLLREMDRAWLDTEIPALDNRTPRDAARDRRLRPRLRALMIDIENQEPRRSARPNDLAWMWKELGLRRP